VTIQELASDYSRRFVGDTRADGSKFRKVADGQETEPLRDLIYKAHGDMLPDDWRYRFIEEALDAIAEADDEDEAELEPSIYTHDLTGWLASRADRYGYCDEWLDEFGVDCLKKPSAGYGHNPTISLLAGGYWMEQREVLASVLESLREQVEAMEEVEA
jgi:hypothetical protein